VPKFRPDRIPADPRVSAGIGVETLLAEVARRHRFLKQLSAVLTADTAIARNPHIRSESIRVSALQWALLIRARNGSTPRGLARELSHSAFGTTTGVYRLLSLRLLYVADHPGRVRSDAPGNIPDHDLAIMSFIRAVATEKAHEKGDSMPGINAGTTLGDAG
jgi:hypothetical protein